MRRALLALAVLAPLVAGCVQPPTAGTPPAGGDGAATLPNLVDVPAKIAKLKHAGQVTFGGGNDLVFRDHYVYESSGSGTHVIDVADPRNPKEVGTAPCLGHDISVVDTPKGRILAVSYQGADDKCPKPVAGGGLRLINVTDPTNPVVLSQVALMQGSHTATPWGDSGLIFNSAYDLTNPEAVHRSQIVNVSDPEAPKVVGEFPFPPDSTSPGCHDILMEPQYQRAVCAAITETMIWDMKDPMHPKILSTIRNPALNIHHSAASARNGTLLILGDEYGGAITPACHPVGMTPTGAIWFYDVKDPASPKMLGYLPPPAGPAKTLCTAHNFNVIDDNHMVSAFYQGGTRLIDFTDPASPVALDQQAPSDGTAWAAYYYRGAVFTGDTQRGLDVYVLK
jgi:hypothetical protein